MSPNSYFFALFLATFFSALLVYLEYDVSAMILFASSWLLIPIFLWTDRITFDGKRLNRTGILPNLWNYFNRSTERLKISDIEQIETQSLRALKRGGNVFYRYRTVIRGRDRRFAFASGGEDYRKMVRELFNRLPESVLDNRSIELRDFLAEPKETLMKAEFAHIPSVEVLENSINDFKISARTAKKQPDSSEIEKAADLHRLANELRLSGYLLQSLEAFRRALLLRPQDAQLIFDFGRCLNSFAGSEKNDKLHRKSLAALRLAEQRAGGDGELLARLGESYFQFGEWERARKLFLKSLENTNENFRSERGLAEVALREGKIAHVIHHFSAANRFARSAALKRWTEKETEYFSRLNSDEDYMDLEISRVNTLESLDDYQKTAVRAAYFAFPLIVAGVIIEEELMTNIGWAVATIALLIKLGATLSRKMLDERIPLDLLRDEDEDEEI